MSTDSSQLLQPDSNPAAEDRQGLMTRLSRFDFQFRKSLGQNFLWRADVLSRICESACIRPGDCVIEVGAGAGTLTGQLAQAVGQRGRVLSWEIDSRLEPILRDYLQAYPWVELRMQDAREADFAACFDAWREEMPGADVRVAANLPYYITTELVTQLLTQLPRATSFCFLVERAAVRRLLAESTDKKAYGPVAILLATFSHGSQKMRLPGAAFLPPPHTESVLLYFEAMQTADQGEEARQFCLRHMEDFAEFLRICFQQRRKTLWNNLKELVAYERLATVLAGLTDAKAAELRPEELTPGFYQSLFRQLAAEILGQEFASPESV